jgi:BirA family biotin operon repressor/biotin-[acetyl-CoA-carboxylase] ligase
VIGRPLLRMPVITSTNDLAKRLAEHGCREGTALVADFQTNGRGRLGRRWEAPAGSSLLLSVVLRPALNQHAVQLLTMLFGLAVVDAVRQEAGLEVGVKWPNDILHGEAKLGGILAEASFRGARLEYCVVGLGLNVDLDPSALGVNLAMPGTSLRQAAGRPASRWSLLHHLLDSLDRRYAAAVGGWSPRDEWEERLTTLGRVVTVTSCGQRKPGVAISVDPEGALIVRLEDGTTERVVAGDVLLHKATGWHDTGGSGTI